MSMTKQVIIIGSGFGGMCAAINLLRDGINDFLILERRAFMGGTWCQNTYPGAAVDVPSPLYSIFSEPYDWSQMFAERNELEAYTNHIIEKHKLADKTVLNACVEQLLWHDDTQQWEIKIVGAMSYFCQFVINATGPLSTPVTPEFVGRESFQGKAFHTNNWDHSIDLKGKKVAVIGSGASGAQVIPAIAPEVEQLYVFQRTPHWIMPRPDRVFSIFQRSMLRKPWAYNLLRRWIYWTFELRVIAFKYSKKALDFVGKNQAIKHIKSQISDPILRSRVMPDYTFGCKRVIMSSTLYPALGRPNVTLQDQGINSITPTGIVTGDGQAIDLDVIVYSTGFDFIDGLISYPVIGRAGKKLHVFWEAYPRAYLGTSVPGFPNLFMITGPNTGIGHTSALFVIEAQLLYIMKCIHAVKVEQARSIDVSSDAEAEYTAMIHREMQQTVWQRGGCKSWYKSDSGYVVAMFPGFTFNFRRLANKFRRKHHVFSR
jgi:cation diffusion facilitator CzcD-associated flavoprotein CzcO